MLSVIIPARNEVYLERTIRNILENARGEIEIIAELDGYLPDPPIDIKDDRVIFVHRPEAIGQRACINHGATIAKGEFIMKLDAHCAVGPGFDAILAQDCEYSTTMIPTMFNLDHETWLPKLHKKTNYMYFSSPSAEKPFRAQYYGGNDTRRLEKRTEMIDDILCTMGPCFFMHKKRFFEQGGCDEGHTGGWGNQGIEVSLKAWLSGGSLKVDKRTWFSHWFRGGGGTGFPYPISGNQVDRAREYSRDLWLNNKWPGQVYPLLWLVEKFWPIPSWTDADLEILKLVGSKFVHPTVSLSGPYRIANLASPVSSPVDFGEQEMSMNAVSSPGLLRAVRISPKNIDPVGSESQMFRVATSPVATDVVDDGNILPKISAKRTNEPSIHDSMNSNLRPQISNSPISEIVLVPDPIPTPSNVVEGDFGEKTNNKIGVEFVDAEKSLDHSPHFTLNTENVKDLTLIYYTANVVARGIEYSVLRALKKFGYPIVSVSQKPMDLGKNIVVPQERSLTNIYRQALIGAKAATTEYVALCEDDCMYVPEHFKFRPTKPFGYNLNRWMLHLDQEQKVYSYRERPILSQCIANREKLIECLEKGDRDREMGREDGYEFETFKTKEPNLVICHSKNTSGQKYLGKDADPRTDLPGWGPAAQWVDKFKRREKWTQ